MSFKKPIFYEYKLEKMSGVDLLGVMHIDDRNNDSIELKVTQGGEPIDLTGATVKARVVTRKTHVLINDNVPCTVNESGNILIPIDRPNVETVKGDLKIEINITNSGGGITLQFPLWVRVNGSILDGAEVTSESKGTIPELLEEVREELERVEVNISYVTPQQYGAKGDGVTDDTDAINACLAENEMVLFSGIYLVNPTANQLENSNCN